MWFVKNMAVGGGYAPAMSFAHLVDTACMAKPDWSQSVYCVKWGHVRLTHVKAWVCPEHNQE